jgi:tetratricopeptide (TPR) repeat protein
MLLGAAVATSGGRVMVVGAFGYRACIVAIAALVLASAAASRAVAADDAAICADETGDVAIAACTRAIKSGRYSGHALATKYTNRGAEWNNKQDYDRAIADLDQALKLDKKYADAFYNRCVSYNGKENFDRATADCSAAIRLGADPSVLNATGSERLSLDHSTSDYYSARGFSYHGKKDYDRAIADYDEAIRLYPDRPTTIKNRGLAYQAKGDTERANADFEKAKQLGK